MPGGWLDKLFEGNEMDKLALELYCCAIMSEDAKNDPLGAVRQHIEKYLGDAVRIVKLNTELSQINAQFVQFYQLNVKNEDNEQA